MIVSVKSRFYRILRRLPPFKECTQWEELAHLSAKFPLDKSEDLIGVYANVLGSLNELVVFTSLGVYWWNDKGWRSVKYEDISFTEWPDEEMADARVLTLRLKSGSHEYLPFKNGGLFDAMRFFNRVVEDIRKKQL